MQRHPNPSETVCRYGTGLFAGGSEYLISSGSNLRLQTGAYLKHVRFR